MSAEASGWVWKNSPYEGSPLLVHLAIADVVNDVHDNEFWMATGNLAEKAKVSRSTVVTTLRDMTARGLLEVVKAGGATREPTRYRFRFVDNPEYLAVDNVATSALTDLASATSGPTSAVGTVSLARPPRTNPIEPNEQTKEASALIGLADPECFVCWGKGFARNPRSGIEGPCDCTKPLAQIEERSA